MKKITLISMIAFLMACNGAKNSSPSIDEFNYSVEKFADVQILRYRVPGFEDLTLKQKEFIYYLNQAALEGRDILYDQNNRYNLRIRRTLEAIYENYDGDKKSAEFEKFSNYLKKVWMGNGIHHHYSEDKFTPEFSKEFFLSSISNIDSTKLPLAEGETVKLFVESLIPVIFDPAIFPKKTIQAEGIDLIAKSANNYYGEGLTQVEVEDFYAKMKNPNDTKPVPYGLNSKLVKENGILKEQTYKVGGLYSASILRIISWLSKASEVAENEKQQDVINSLISFYKTGNLKTYDEYAIKWVQDLDSRIDFVNGFTETYGDPLGMKASWESIVNFKDIEATKRTETISSNAQWFEDNSPIDKKFKKEKVKGVSAKVITVAILGGDCYPATPIGINLPNSNWIRQEYGSKSVTIENITEAYDQSSLGNGFADEFMYSEVEKERAKKYASITNNLHTDLHECLGHGSGKLLPGVDPDALKAYGSVIEETRADLFGLYYMADPKMLELKLLPNDEAYKAEYYGFIMNGLMTQLTRILPGKNIEQAHMRNRQLIASWVFEKGQSDNVIELVKRDGKTFVVINNYEKLRNLFGDLLFKIQEIKSTGDLEGGKKLVENYAIKVNQIIHSEILERYNKLNLAPYRGFVNPVYNLVKDDSGKIIDVKISYTESYVEQHLRYSKEYSSLPHIN